MTGLPGPRALAGSCSVISGKLDQVVSFNFVYKKTGDTDVENR